MKGTLTAMRTLATAVDRGDLLLFAGLGSVAYGLGCWSVPLACVTVGGLVLALVWPTSGEDAAVRRKG